MRIEIMRPTHVAAVAELEKICFSEPWSENALGLLLSQNAVGVVCVVEGVVAAYGGMLWAVDEGQITNIAVLPAFRRRGCGKAVLQALMQLAKEKNCTSVSLEVRASNAAAIALYEQADFFVAGRRKHFYRAPTEDALVMLCNLTERS